MLLRRFVRVEATPGGRMTARLEADGQERTPRLVKWAVQATRKPKDHETADTLYGRWRTEAAERGVDPDILVREVTGRTLDRDLDRTVSAEAVGRLFDRLAGPEGLTATASTFARPDVLVAPDPTRFWDHERRYINHADHRAVGEACMAVVNPDSSTRPMFPELLDEGLEPFELHYLWIPSYEGDADTYVDITDTIEAKIEALRCHKSQIHDWPVDEWIKDRARQRGAAGGMEFAESFKTFKLREEER